MAVNIEALADNILLQLEDRDDELHIGVDIFLDAYIDADEAATLNDLLNVQGPYFYFVHHERGSRKIKITIV